MTVDKKIVPDELSEFVKQRIIDCEKICKDSEELAEKIKDSDLILFSIYNEKSNIYSELYASYMINAVTLSVINSFSGVIGNLAKKEEVNAIKAEIKVNETLSPIREEYAKAKERERSGGDIYE
jgi:hypothetical protein